LVTPVLDLSRSFARLGKGAPNRIDRVERAYLDEVIRREGWGLIRTVRGFLLFEPDRLARLPEYLSREDQDAADQASTIRAIASSRSSSLSIRKIMWRMPNGLAYINVGQKNLNPGTFRAMMEMPDNRKIVFFYDTTPLDHPGFQREAERAEFVEQLTTAINFANHIIVPSDYVREKIEEKMVGTGHRVPVLTAPLGVDLGPQPLHIARAGKPYFVALGTINPSKNYGLLLSIWDRMRKKMDESRIPELRFIGPRGHRDPEVFDMLDHSSQMGRTIFELGPLDDEEMKEQLAGAAALLYPSEVEGFALPPFEAAALGVTTISSPLRSVEVHLGDMAVYADPSDMYQWFQAIRELAAEDMNEQAKRRARLKGYALPTWERHFERVFSVI
jgi:hypothetical protein